MSASGVYVGGTSPLKSAVRVGLQEKGVLLALDPISAKATINVDEDGEFVQNEAEIASAQARAMITGFAGESLSINDVVDASKGVVEDTLNGTPLGRIIKHGPKAELGTIIDLAVTVIEDMSTTAGTRKGFWAGFAAFFGSLLRALLGKKGA